MSVERLDTLNVTSKLMLTFLASVATVEAENYTGAAAGGDRCRQVTGKYKGRPVNIDAGEVRRMKGVETGPAAIDKQLGVAGSSVYRMLDRHVWNVASLIPCLRQR